MWTLWSLRQLIPARTCTPDEVRRIAEVQATRLGEILSRTEPGSEGIEARHIAAMPRMRVVYEALPVSGLSHWNGHEPLSIQTSRGRLGTYYDYFYCTGRQLRKNGCTFIATDQRRIEDLVDAFWHKPAAPIGRDAQLRWKSEKTLVHEVQGSNMSLLVERKR